MNKKIGLISSIAVGALLLTSCQGQSVEDLSALRKDVPTDAVKSELGLNDLSDSSKRKIIYEGESDGYTFYVANDASFSASLFKVSVSLTSAGEDNTYNYFKEHYNKVKTVTASEFYFQTPLTANGIYSAEQSALLKGLYSENGMSKLSFPGELAYTSTSSALTCALSTVPAKLYYEALAKAASVNAETKPEDTVVTETITLETLYMPVYMERLYNSQLCLSAYAFIPVYMQMVNGAGKTISYVEKDANGKESYELVDSKLASVREAHPDIISAKRVNDGNYVAPATSSTN